MKPVKPVRISNDRLINAMGNRRFALANPLKVVIRIMVINGESDNSVTLRQI